MQRFNQSESFGDYTRKPFSDPRLKEASRVKTWVSYNKVEGSSTGESLGDGTYLHVGDPVENELEIRTIESPKASISAAEDKSRLETEMSTPSDETVIDKTSKAVVEFDFNTKTASMAVTMNDGRMSVVSGTPEELVSWIKLELHRNKARG